MSTIEVNKITPVSGGTAIQIGESGDTITVPSGATITNSGTANNFTSYRPNAQALIINGSMALAQRGTSTSSVTTASYPACDRWNFAISSGGTWTVSQDTDVPSGEGFSTSAKYDCTTAQGTLGAAAYIQHRQSIEGQNLQLLKKGTSNAETVTISFWVKATKTGTNILELYDNTNNRQCSQSYTISSSDTWEKKVVNFPADTSGALANNNSGALNVQFYLGAGSNLSSGTLQTTWASYVNANRAVGQVNHADSTSNNFYITGVQMEVGTYTSATLPPFQHESFADNLDRCQRYYISYGNVGTTQSGFPARAYSGSGLMWAVTLPKPLRASPTVTLTGTIRAFGSSNTHDSTSALGVASYANTNSTIVMLNSTGFSGLSNDRSYNVMAINDTFYTLDAEL